MSRRYARRRLSAAVAVAAMVLSVFGGSSQSASADTAPRANSTLPATVSNDVLPTAQINGIAWSQVTVGNVVYVTGSFTSSRPAGSPLGRNEVARRSILAYNLTTGVLIPSFNHSLNGAGRIMVASPDHTRLYVGGDFTLVDGAAHGHLAEFNIATGALVAGFTPSLNAQVLALAATNTAVYTGGAFVRANGVLRTHLAAFSTSGALTGWAPRADNGSVTAMVVAPGGTVLVAAGRFTTLNGAARYGIGALSVSSGQLTAWNSTFPVRDAGLNASFTSLVSDGTQVYGSGYTFGGGGNFEGTIAMSATGTVAWMNSCHGDTYSVFAAGSVLYSVSHAHDCSDVGGWEQTNPESWYRAGASTTYPATGCRLSQNNNVRYANFAGQPCATRLDWYPQLTPGTVSGAAQAAWSVTGNASFVALGGEFPSVNGIAQQGLVRFAVRSIAPNKSGPIPAGTVLPAATSPQRGIARVQWGTTWDRDNENLTYQLFRDGGTTPIDTVTQASTFWNLPMLSYLDTGLVPGSSHAYRITVSDPFGNTFVTGRGAPVTVATDPSRPDPYGSAVLADDPTLYYRMNETAGPGAIDATGAGNNATFSGAVTYAATSPVTGQGTAVSFDGTTASLSSATASAAPATFSEELWFATTTNRGGKLIGFENARTGSGTRFDRQVYMNSSGTLSFGTLGTVRNVATSSRGFNDGKWHHLVATHSAAGMQLYVDGALVAANAGSAGGSYAGYWRVGGGASWSTPSGYFAGSIDEVAVYPVVLSAGQVAAHYAASVLVHPIVNSAPTASFTSSSSGLTLSLDGSSSTDSDGLLAGYTWDFGDGSTGTGVTTTHTYSAPGTYPVTLTAVDNAGAPGTFTASVTVATAVLLAQDEFNRTSPVGWGTADRGGAWTVSPANSWTVLPGAGQVAALTPGSSASANLDGVSSTETDTALTLSLSQAATGSGTTVNVIGRRINGVGSYRAKVRFLADGSVQVSLASTNSVGAETVITPAVTVTDLVYQPGDQVRIRLRVSSSDGQSNLSVKLWSANSYEPDTWLLSGSDATAGLQSPGGLGVNVYLSSSSDATAPVISFSDLRVFDATTI